MTIIDRLGHTVGAILPNASDADPNSDLAIKTPVRVATTANIVLNGLLTIDGVTVVAGDRVLVRSQTDATQNGIYTVSSGNWSRCSDFDRSGEVVRGTLVYINEGATNGAKSSYVTSADPITLDATAITFSTPASTIVANPSATIGLTAINGSASSAMRSDGAPALSQSISPTMTGLWKFTGFPIILGSAAATDSDPAMEITRAFDNTGSGNGHGYADLTTATRTAGGPIGYNSFDAATIYSGSGNFDHYAGFQARPIISTSGSTSIVYGFASLPQIYTGSLTTLNHVDVFDAIGTGTVGTQYGLRVLSLTKAATNWAVNTEGTTPSIFGGIVTISGGAKPGSFTVAGLPAGSTGLSVWCSNCRVFNGAGTQEGVGSGTGGLVTYNGTAWKIAGTNVTAVA